MTVWGIHLLTLFCLQKEGNHPDGRGDMPPFSRRVQDKFQEKSNDPHHWGGSLAHVSHAVWAEGTLEKQEEKVDKKGEYTYREYHLPGGVNAKDGVWQLGIDTFSDGRREISHAFLDTRKPTNNTLVATTTSKTTTTSSKATPPDPFKPFTKVKPLSILPKAQISGGRGKAAPLKGNGSIQPPKKGVQPPLPKLKTGMLPGAKPFPKVKPFIQKKYIMQTPQKVLLKSPQPKPKPSFLQSPKQKPYIPP